MSLYDSLCYQSQQFQLVNQDTICYLSAGALYFWDLGTNRKDFIFSQKHGFQSFATNHYLGLVAVAEYCKNPQVLIYQYPSKKLVKSISGISQLEILKMNLSFDGTKLLVVTGVPTYHIAVWDLEQEKQLAGEKSTIPLRSNFITASFSPFKDHQFGILYENTFQLCEITPSFEAGEQGLEEDQVELSIRINQQSIQAAQNSQSKFVTFIWDEQNNIYLVDGFSILYLNGSNLQEIMKHECDFVPKFLLLTQKHLIIIYPSGKFEWIFKYDQNNLNDEDLRPFKLDKVFQYNDKAINCILYNHQYTKMYASTEEGYIVTFPKEGESNMLEEEEEPQDKDQEKKEEEEEEQELEIETINVGPFPTSSIIYIKEISKGNNVFFISQSGDCYLYDFYNKEVISHFKQNCQVTCADIDNDEQYLVTGSSEGVVRIYDFSNPKEVNLLKQVKIIEKKRIDNIQINKEKTLIAVSAKSSKKIFFVSIKNQIYKVVGYVVMPSKVNSICWNYSNKQLVLSETGTVLFVLLNYLLVAICPPDPEAIHKDLKLDNEACPQFGRKIDPDLQNMCLSLSTGDLLLTGNDKILKRYKQPEEQLAKLDMKVKIGLPPSEELDGHDLSVNVIKSQIEQRIVVSGSCDGTIIIRNMDQLSETKKIKAHNLKSKGVSSIEYSKKHKLCYSGGFDGSFLIWKFGDVQISSGEKVQFSQVSKGTKIEDMKDSSIQHYKKVLEEEYVKTQREQREKTKQDILTNIKDIEVSLNKLLKENEQADELEKLNRDDFVIDIETRDHIIQEGTKEREKMKDLAKNENFKLEILHKRIKDRTWDQMKEHLTALNGLDLNIIVYNYHIRKRSPQELLQMKQIQDLRKIEIKEKQLRKENKTQEIFAIEQMIENPQGYIVNAIPGKGPLVLIDYEQKEEAKQQEALSTKTNDQGRPVGGRVRLQDKKKNEADKAKEQANIQEEEEKKKKEEQQKQSIENKAKEEGQQGGQSAEMQEWDYLYGALELYSNNRKRNQIVLLNNIIFRVKEEFNQEFGKVLQFRNNSLDNVIEKNKRISEILEELHKDKSEIFDPKKNFLENPEERILKVDGKKEIPFQKFLTREERKKIEDERLREEERIRALMADDAGIRAVKQMMGGTLEEKKETPLDEQIQQEEWMKKPQEELTEEEKTRLKEFEVKKQKLDEEKEKLKKNLENELKKLKNDVSEICQKFDQKLLILFRRKLEYDYRIAEQELYIEKLVLSIYLQNGIIEKKDQINSNLNSLEEKINKLDLLRKILQEKIKNEDQNKQQIQERFNGVFRNPHLNLQDGAKALKQIWQYAFDDFKTDKARMDEWDKNIMDDKNFTQQLIKLDPYLILQRKQISKDKEQQFESYKKDIDYKIANSNFQIIEQNEKDFEQSEKYQEIIRKLREKFESKYELAKIEKQFQDLTYALNYIEQDYESLNNQFNESRQFQDCYDQELQRIKSNIEILVRFKQGYVEIPQDKPIPSMNDTILIPKKIIEEYNFSIQKQGQIKIKLLEEIKNIKFSVENKNYELQKRDLTIQKLECETKEVQLLKVKKEMQIALTKKDMKLNEYELKNLSDQIEMLKSATDKRINIYEKKLVKIKEQIDFINKENDQLERQRIKLEETVNEREKIAEMQQKNNKQFIGVPQQIKGQENKANSDTYEKFKQISKNRQLFDMAKSQTEEIELLREELNKLKARTFANFSAIQK